MEGCALFLCTPHIYEEESRQQSTRVFSKPKEANRKFLENEEQDVLEESKRLENPKPKQCAYEESISTADRGSMGWSTLVVYANAVRPPVLFVYHSSFDHPSCHGYEILR